MKKIMKPFVLVAAAAMALASCQKNEIPAPEKQDVHFTINAGIETKTSIADNGDGTYSPSWENGDQIGIFFTEPKEKVEKVDATFSNTKEDGPVASFEGTATVEGEGAFYAFYPKSAFNQHYGDETIRLDLSAVQKPTSTSFDPACDILVAKPCDYLADGETVVIDDLYFARLMSVLKINLKGEFAQGEIVESLTFSVDGVDITGNAKVDYKNATITAWNNGNVDRNVVTASYAEDRYITIAEGNNAAYLVVAPTTIPAGTSLSFTLKTANYNISKTVSAPSDMTFTAGNLSVLNLTIAADNCDKIDTSIDYSGEYLIVNTDLTKAASKWANGNNLPAAALNAVDGVVYESDNLDDCMMTITKVLEGDNAGKYTIVDAAGKYLYAAGGSGSSPSNHLKGSDDVSYWNIEADGTKFVMTSLSGATRNILRYNGTNNPPIFSCYGSGQSDVTLYKYSDIKPDTTPSISLTNNSAQVTFDATSYEFTYTTKNITGNVAATIKEGATMTNVSASVSTSASNGTVTVNFDANADAEQKTATIVLSYEGAASQEFVLTQTGKSAENVPVQKSVTYTVASTSSVTVSGDAPAGASATYSSTYNTKCQLTSGNSMTFTLSGYSGCTINGVTLSMKSNSSKGAGSLSIKAGNKDVGKISAAKFNTSSWYGAWSTSYVDVKPTITSTVVGSGEDIVITISATENSLYCQSVKIEYTTSGVSGDGGGETPDSEPKSYTLTIDAASFNTTSYAANNNEKTSKATASDGSSMDVKWTSYQVMKQSNAMQWQKNAGYIYNSTDLGTITDVTITSSAGTFTKYINTAQKPTSNGTGGYFHIKVGGATGTASKIVIKFTK